MDVQSPNYTVLHTDDNPSWSPLITRAFSSFGINVDSFATNEGGLTAAIQKQAQGANYNAAIVDYNTETPLKGADLIANLANIKACENLFVLSSSTDREILTSSLKTALEKQDVQETTVHIFDKTNEQNLAVLFVAMKILYPEEANELTREDLVRWVGYKLDESGEAVDGKDEYRPNEYVTDIWRKFIEITNLDTVDDRKQALLETLKTAISLREGNRRGNPESEPI